MKQRLRLAALWCARAMGVFALARRLTKDAVMIVGWHGVSVENEHHRFASLFISPESMRRRLAFLSRHYAVINLDELVRQHAAGAFKPRQVVLTFDDGFENFRTAAVPLLRDFSMTATNYIVSEYIETGAPNYRMMVRDLVRLTAPPSSDIVFPGGTPMPRGAAMLTMETAGLGEYDALPADRNAREHYVRRLGELLAVDVDRLLRERIWHCLGPTEIRDLAREGFAMQLHTHSHLNVVDHAADTAEQVRLCRQAVERTTGLPAPHFCYPSGRWTKAAWIPLQAHGVTTATTTRTGPNLPSTPLLALRRLMNGEDRTQLEFEFELSNVRWLILRLVGKADTSTPSEKVRAYRETRGNL